MATVVTRADIAADLVEALVEATLDGRAKLAIRAPVLQGLDLAATSGAGPSAPLHPGAVSSFERFAAAAAKP